MAGKTPKDKGAERGAAVGNGGRGAAKPSPGKGDAYANFDIEDPKLPDAIEEAALASGGYPYDKRIKEEKYLEQLHDLHIELLKMHKWLADTKNRLVIVLEGRDAAGKGGVIAALAQHLNPRYAHVVALTKPTETEAGQWYFQRYIAHLPAAGTLTVFDRSWYNRAGVERVMGFCSADQLADFLRDAPAFESLVVRDGIILVKLYLSVGRETQLKRLHSRHHDPLKQWKLSPIDIKGLHKWDEYTAAQEDMFRFTHTSEAPWTVVKSNDKYRARLEAIRHVLSQMAYADKDKAKIGKTDPLLVGSGPGFFD
jgi:polyphosphate kinase